MSGRPARRRSYQSVTDRRAKPNGCDWAASIAPLAGVPPYVAKVQSHLFPLVVTHDACSNPCFWLTILRFSDGARGSGATVAPVRCNGRLARVSHQNPLRFAQEVWQPVWLQVEVETHASFDRAALTGEPSSEESRGSRVCGGVDDTYLQGKVIGTHARQGR